MRKYTGTIIAVLVAVVAGVYLAFASVDSDDNTTDNGSDNAQVANPETEIPDRLTRSAVNADFSNTSIDLDLVLSGGPPKDGIPSIDEPKFTQIQDAEVTDETQVIVVENNGETKIYPYSILVWHEIVNDTVGGKPLAITFCPLCGSAIVFDREIDAGNVVEFGVSGFLYESNLLMYSREDNESLWSQSLGEAVIGARNGERLERFPLQLLTYADAVEQFPNATVLSEDTGFSRDYGGNPYVGYEDTEDTIFPVSVQDNRFPAKEIFYIVPIEGSSVAVRLDKSDGVYQVPDTDVFVTVDKGQVTANWGEAVLPGYFEMWFSWATHHNATGIVL